MLLWFPQGVQSIKESELDKVALYVHIKPPSIEALEERLRARNSETDEAIMKRLEVAKQELEFGKHTPHTNSQAIGILTTWI